MYKRYCIWLAMLMAAVLLPTTSVLADEGSPGDDGVVIWNEDYTLKEGERLDGDLVVFNGDATLEPGSHVEGSVIVWNGSADVEGTIDQDLVVSGGDIKIENDAWVKGSVICSWDCDLDQREEARIDGEIIEGVPWGGRGLEPGEELPPIRPIPQVPFPLTNWASGPGRVLDWVFGILRGIVSVLVVAAIGGLVALIWPQQTTEIGRAVVEWPGPSLGFGLLTAIAGAALIVALGITICLSPAAILVALALGAAGLLGWICVGALVGERLLKALNAQETAPIWAAGLGTLVITMVTAGLGMVRCLGVLGWLLVVIVGCLGLGAVVLTRFGTTVYAPSRPAPSPPPPAEPSASANAPEPEEETEEG